MKQLRIGEGLSLPLDAITQTFGILAVRGAGKSNAAAVMAEEMWEHGLPFVVVDPVGSWHGLRSSGDGKKPGLAVPIFGGAHGDVPLERTAGQVIADLVVGERLSCVVDVSDFSEGDKIRFLIDFAERLYRKNQDPLHLFLEEADDYAPQRPFREQARLLRAWENIVRRGRARGLGITMISQRSASLNKSVLTQIETLFVLRTTSPQDRKAIGAWVEYHGQAKELLESLPGLEAGEAWVWSPSWLRTMKRVQVRRRWTFDSAATPKDVRGARPPATLADVDLGAVKAQMAATIERAKAEDPRELKRRISELERQLKAVPVSAPQVRSEKVNRVEIPILKDTQVKRLEVAVDRARDAAAALLKRHNEQVDRLSQRMQVVVSEVGMLSEQIKAATGAAARDTQRGAAGRILAADGRSRAAVPHSMQPRPSPAVRPRANGKADASAEGLAGVEQKILDEMADLLELGIAEPERVQVGLFAGYTNPRSGGFSEPCGRLIKAGLVATPRTGVLRLTDAGRAAARASGTPATSEEVQERLIAKLDGVRGRILRAVIAAYPERLDKDELGRSLGYTNPRSGGFSEPLGSLRTLGLVEYPERGRVVASRRLFFEGGA